MKLAVCNPENVLHQSKSFIRTLPCWHPDLELPACRTLRNNFLLFISYLVYDIFYSSWNGPKQEGDWGFYSDSQGQLLWSNLHSHRRYYLHFYREGTGVHRDCHLLRVTELVSERAGLNQGVLIHVLFNTLRCLGSIAITKPLLDEHSSSPLSHSHPMPRSTLTPTFLSFISWTQGQTPVTSPSTPRGSP